MKVRGKRKKEKEKNVLRAQVDIRIALSPPAGLYTSFFCRWTLQSIEI